MFVNTPSVSADFTAEQVNATWPYFLPKTPPVWGLDEP